MHCCLGDEDLFDPFNRSSADLLEDRLRHLQADSELLDYKELDQKIGCLIESCIELHQQAKELRQLRRKANYFIAVYGPWYDKYTKGAEMFEALTLVQNFMLCLAIGSLQSYPRVQVIRYCDSALVVFHCVQTRISMAF